MHKRGGRLGILGKKFYTSLCYERGVFFAKYFFSRVKFELNPVTNSPVADPLNPPLVSASSTRPIKTWLIWTETAETEMELWNHQLHRCHTFPEKFLSGEVPLVITSQLPSYTKHSSEAKCWYFDGSMLFWIWISQVRVFLWQRSLFTISEAVLISSVILFKQCLNPLGAAGLMGGLMGALCRASATVNLRLSTSTKIVHLNQPKIGSQPLNTDTSQAQQCCRQRNI